MAAAPERLTRWDGQEVEELAREWGVPHLEAYGALGSTNDRARALAEAGCPAWTTVVADAQTRGKGRRGSAWLSAPGTGLLLSVVVRDEATRGPVSLLAGLACAEAMEAVGPSLTVGLKWPNDIIVDGGKVGGVLCEVVGDAVVVGVGINVSGAPSAHVLDRPSAFPPAALEVGDGKRVARRDVADAVLSAMRARLGDVSISNDVLAEIRRRDVLDGRLVETEQEGEGRAAGMDATGALLLVGSDGREVRIVSGSVRLSSRADAGPPVSEGT